MVFHGRGDSVIALERVNMHVPTGQFASIIGPSGCGKSTLLRLIADILQPHSGTIDPRKRYAARRPPRPRAGLRIPEPDIVAMAHRPPECRAAARCRRSQQHAPLGAFHRRVDRAWSD